MYVNELFNGTEKICDMRIVSGFNGNIRPNISKFELVLPNQNKEQENETIDYIDCSYVFDDKERRVKLFHEKIGKFTSLSLGSLMPLYLPGITGILHSIFTNSLSFRGFDQMLNENDEINFLPRMKLGNIIISRKCWKINSKILKKYINYNENSSIVFKDINKFIDRFNIPKSVFIRKNIKKEMTEMFNGEDDDQKLDMTLRKPQFIDFENPLLVKLFINMFSEQEELIIEEAYPNYVGKNVHVQEQVIELSIIKE